MPAKNIIKDYREQGFYHVYNRGVEKRVIFSDHLDESVFLNYLRDYLSPRDVVKLSQIINDSEESPMNKETAKKLLRINNFSDQVDLLAYCLMPNHFHLLIRQNSSRAMEMLMRSLITRYVQYFNHRHDKRVGALFQNTYKAVLVDSEGQLLHLSRYIHRNPLQKGVTLQESPQPSSFGNYLGRVHQNWVKPQEILGYFSKSGFNSYMSFVEDSAFDEVSITSIYSHAIDPDE